MQASGHYDMTGNSFCALNYFIQKMLEDDISVAPGIRHMKKCKGNVRKKRYSTPKITSVNLHLLITLHIFT